jgi:hypothetical protein
MELATIGAAAIAPPCRVARGGGRLIDRLRWWDPWQGAWLRLVGRLRAGRLQ